MTTNKNKRKRGKASRQSNRAAKRRKSKKENNTSAHSLPAKPATTVLMLLQPPKKWTSRHLEVTRLKLRDDVSSSTITGDGHIPRDVLFWTRVYRRLFFWHCDQGLFLLLPIAKDENTNWPYNASFWGGCCVFLSTKQRGTGHRS